MKASKKSSSFRPKKALICTGVTVRSFRKLLPLNWFQVFCLCGLSIGFFLYSATLYDINILPGSQYTDFNDFETTTRQYEVEITEEAEIKEEIRYYKRPPGTEHLKCSWLMEGNHTDYIKKLAKKRMTYTDPKNFTGLPMDCTSIKARHRFPTIPTSKEEADFPLAYARNVYTDYFYLEMLLSASYQPQNYYCFSIDKKSSDLFKMRMQALANCFSNVFISNNTRWLDSFGHNQDWSHLDCLRILAKKEKKWKYVQLLQNHDFPLKTNLETVRIFKLFNGSNDIQTTKEHGRVDYKKNWTFVNIGIFRNESRLHEIANYSTARLTFVKGNNALSVVREAVDYVLFDLNITKTISMIDDGKKFAVDEVLFPTLLSNEDLRAPGYYTQTCVKKGINHGGVTRMAYWSYLKPPCYSGHFRHAICVFGVADLAKNLDKSDHLNGNKMLPSFDFNAITCWMEPKNRIHEHFYRTLPAVRFQKYKDKNGRVSKEALKSFKCGTSTG
uniref:Uncharacterized protein n=1 Tax=Bursaphelenchus xylophilus TaxID=6326 RepID=A0A1I7S5S1_BURXY